MQSWLVQVVFDRTEGQSLPQGASKRGGAFPGKLKLWLFYLLELREMFQCFHHSLMLPSLEQALQFCAGFPHGNVAEGKGGTGLEKGVGDSAKTGAAAAHPEPGCAMGSRQPK